MPVYPETDKTILENIISGNEVSWQDFYVRYAPVVRALCTASRLPPESHDDVVQEVMSRFARRSSSYVYAPERARFRTYFNCIVRGAIADVFRRKAKQERILKEFSETEILTESEWEASELTAWRKAVLEEALHELAARVSSVNYLAFTMSSLQGHSIRETAAFFGISAARVYQARNRCTAILQEIISRCNGCDPELHLQFPEK